MQFLRLLRTIVVVFHWESLSAIAAWERNAFLSLQFFVCEQKSIRKKRYIGLSFKQKTLENWAWHWSFIEALAGLILILNIIFPLSHICMSFWDERKYTFLQYLKRKFSSRQFFGFPKREKEIYLWVFSYLKRAKTK